MYSKLHTLLFLLRKGQEHSMNTRIYFLIHFSYLGPLQYLFCSWSNEAFFKFVRNMRKPGCLSFPEGEVGMIKLAQHVLSAFSSLFTCICCLYLGRKTKQHVYSLESYEVSPGLLICTRRIIES